jgi:hypothetical protein
MNPQLEQLYAECSKINQDQQRALEVELMMVETTDEELFLLKNHPVTKECAKAMENYIENVCVSAKTPDEASMCLQEACLAVAASL